MHGDGALHGLVMVLVDVLGLKDDRNGLTFSMNRGFLRGLQKGGGGGGTVEVGF